MSLAILNQINRDRLAEYNTFLDQMNKRALSSFYNTEYVPSDPAMDKSIMYYTPVILTPGEKRTLISSFFGADPAKVDYYNKALSWIASCMYGSEECLMFITGKTNPNDYWIDFTRVYYDPEYVKLLRENLKFARSIGHKLWATTEIHTSVQVASRDYCRIKYNDSTRKFTDLDVIEWIASFKFNGVMDKIFEAKTLEEAFIQLTTPRGIGPYFGYISIALIATLQCTNYFHDERFCAPGKGAQKTVEYLFEDYKAKGNKIKHSELICTLAEYQDQFLDVTIPLEFRNIEVDYYGKYLKRDQELYTCSGIEVGMCQFGVYRKFRDNIEASKKRLNKTIDLTPFIQRELTGEYNKTNVNLLSFE